jgi:prepilin-type N-terminal cleavage/methylation domain-containing protein
MQRSSGATGYTLLEISISLGVLGILLAFGLVSVREILLSNRLRSEAVVLAQTIANYSSLAQTEDMRLVLAVYPEDFKIHRGELGGEILFGHRFKHPVQATAISGPIGMAASGAITPATVELRLNESLCRVIVALRGRTTIDCG